jgi:uncharacterized membrane-anchored protein YjiN (DUF445 family)
MKNNQLALRNKGINLSETQFEKIKMLSEVVVETSSIQMALTHDLKDAIEALRDSPEFRRVKELKQELKKTKGINISATEQLNGVKKVVFADFMPESNFSEKMKALNSELQISSNFISPKTQLKLTGA